MTIPKSHQDYKAAQISTANSVAILLSGALLGPRWNGQQCTPYDVAMLVKGLLVDFKIKWRLKNQEAYIRKMQKGRNIQNFWDTQTNV